MTGYNGYIEDTPEVHNFALAIGKFLVNFGGIEHLTHEILKIIMMEKTYLKSKDMDFSKRIKKILGMVNSGAFNHDLKESCRVACINALTLSDVRAAISHNPVCQRSTKQINGSPLISYEIVVMKASKDGNLAPIIGLDSVNKWVDNAATTARHFDEVFQQLKSVA